MIEMPWWLAAIIAAIPTGITGLAFWLLQKRITKRDAEQVQRDEARLKNEVMLIQKVDAALCLAEATARAVQRIPDAKCNGDMHEALEYAHRIKHEHRKFMTEQGVHQLYD
jgi:hypothetical protein